MDKQEFLERLKNPVRFQIRDQVKAFRAGIQYYTWDHITNVSTYEKNGSHEITIVMRDTRFMTEIKRQIISHFPHSKDYRVMSGGAVNMDMPNGDEIYTFRMAIVEEANYAVRVGIPP